MKTRPLKNPILLISKPICPPWNDSGKNLIRDIIAHSHTTEFHFFSHRQFESPWSHAHKEPLYSGSGTFSPSVLQKARVFFRLLSPDKISVYHFFFAPNPLTSLTARMVLTLKQRISIHTILSAPKSFTEIHRILFADHIVVLSQHTANKLREQGVENVTLIPPGIPILPPIPQDKKQGIRKKFRLDHRPIILYTGDYEFSNAAWTILDAIPRVIREVNVQFVYACRIKQPKSKTIESAIKLEVAQNGLQGHVTFFNALENIRELISISAMSLMPAESLYAKMDIPLVLLESLSENVPIIIANQSPLQEILKDDYGFAIPPNDSTTLSQRIIQLIQDPDRRRHMGEVGRLWVSKAFDVKTMVQRYENLYRELLRNAKRTQTVL